MFFWTVINESDSIFDFAENPHTTEQKFWLTGQDYDKLEFVLLATGLILIYTIYT